jgi:MFS family permease
VVCWILAASVLVLVVPVGALLAGFAMEYVGRLNTIKIAVVPCLLGWFLIATGSSFGAVLCGRLLTGVSAGSNSHSHSHTLVRSIALLACTEPGQLIRYSGHSELDSRHGQIFLFSTKPGIPLGGHPTGTGSLSSDGEVDGEPTALSAGIWS